MMSFPNGYIRCNTKKKSKSQKLNYLRVERKKKQLSDNYSTIIKPFKYQ